MISTENRARAAMRAIGDTVRDAPPLELAAARDHRRDRARDHAPWRRSWRSRLTPVVAPIAAAVAIAAVAITLVLVRDVPGNQVAAPSPSATAGMPANVTTIPGVPAYFVAWMQASTPYLVIGETATGRVDATVKEPSGVFLEGIYGAAADDRTFIAMGDRLRGPDAGKPAWYLLRIGPGVVPRLTPLAIPVRQNPAGVALSPDGTEVAIALPGIPAKLQVYSVASGKLLRTWATRTLGELAVESASAAGGSSQFTAARVLRWSSDGKQLAFAWNSAEIRVLDASAPDGMLLARSSELAVIGTTQIPDASYSCDASQGWELIASGHGVVCAGSMQAAQAKTGAAAGGGCSPSQRKVIGFLQENAGAEGGLTTSLADDETECPAESDVTDGAYLGWASPDGSTLIGSLVWDGQLRFGVFRDGRYTPLPALPVSVPVTTGVLIGTYDW